MTPYWERRVDGRRFSEWAAVIGGVILVGLCIAKLFRPHPTDWDYFLVGCWGLLTLVSGFRLYMSKRSPAA